MELTAIQTEILTTLVNLFHQEGRAVKGGELARVVCRNSGTVRNQMQTLRTLGLVEGLPGPKGGYRPTNQTYEVLDIIDHPDEAATNIYRNGKLVDGATACEISFITVRNLNTCNGRVRVIGDIRRFDNGDVIKIGPTPNNNLVIRGKVVGRDDTRNILIFTISDLLTLPKQCIRECIQHSHALVDMDAAIKDAANVLIERKLRGMPVIDGTKVVGIVTLTDITKALVSGLVNQRVWGVMSDDPIEINGDTSISSVAELFDRYNVDGIVVIVNGKPYGVVFKDDILRESTRVSESIIAPSFMSA